MRHVDERLYFSSVGFSLEGSRMGPFNPLILKTLDTTKPRGKAQGLGWVRILYTDGSIIYYPNLPLKGVLRYSGPIKAHINFLEIMSQIDNFLSFVTQCGSCIAGGEVKIYFRIPTLVETFPFVERLVTVSAQTV